MRYDVIVVGAGPAGSTAARECADRGLDVLLLDKAEFPRDKPCGGAVTINAARLLPFDLGPVVEREVSSMCISLRRGQEFTRYSPEHLVLLTQRSRLDTFLVERAIESAVTFRQRAPVREVLRYPSHVVVRAGRESFEGSTLVAADGANGMTAKLSGLTMNICHGIALEGNITPPNGFPEKWEQAIGLDLGDLPGGYGWIFPKGDHLNIGIGGWRYVAPKLRERLDGLVDSYGYDPKGLWGLRGYHLPIRYQDSAFVDGNVLVVGDAAGLIDPMTGEGITMAFKSGRIAAEHLADYLSNGARDLQGYARGLEREVLPDLAVSRKLHDLFHLSPGLFIGIERRTSILWKGVRNLLLGTQTYWGIRGRFGLIWTVVEFVSDLVRTTPSLQRKAGLRDPAPPERFFLGSTRHR